MRRRAIKVAKKIEKLKNLDIQSVNLVEDMMEEIANDVWEDHKDNTLMQSWYRFNRPRGINVSKLEKDRESFIEQATEFLNKYHSVHNGKGIFSALKYVGTEEIEITGCVEWKLERTNGVLIIPEYIDGKKVTSIRSQAFCECEKLKQVIIEGDLHLGYASFSGCTNLESFIAPNLTRIVRADMFRFCESLSYVNLFNLVSIEDIDTFAHCKSLKKLELPKLRNIDTWDIFSFMNSLEELHLPKLESSGSLSLMLSGETRVDLELVVGTNRDSTAFKSADPNQDTHTPSLKKLVIPEHFINKYIDLSALSFEVKLIDTESKFIVDKKYELVKDDYIEYNGSTLYRIRALKDFGNVSAGDLGGYVESEANLSHDGNCWVYGRAKVYGDARVYGDAKVFGYAKVYGDAQVYDSARVYGNSEVYGNAKVYGDAQVFGYAQVYDNAQVYGEAEVHAYAQVYGYAQVCGEARVYGYVEVYDNAKVYAKAEIYNCDIVCGNSQISH